LAHSHRVQSFFLACFVQVYLSRLRSSLPELPLATRSRLLSSHPRLTNEDITKLLALDPETNTGVAFFESLLSAGPSREAKVCMNWVVNNLSGALRRTGREWAQRGLTAAEVGEIVDLVGEARLTTTNGNNLLRQLVALPPLEIGPTSSATSPPSSRIPSLLETHASLLSTPAPSPSSSSPSIHSSSSSSTTPPPAASTDPTEDLITAVLDSNPKMVKDLQAGKKPGMVMSLVGSVMKQSGGRADAKAVGLRIRERLGLEQP
jgi:Asp-tRNA(Asn)/Glu-tRNA(Gln) amidotransferase B subunit